MQRVAWVVAILFVVGSLGVAMAQCNGGCGGCSDNCPGHGQTMTSVSGKITWICPKHQAVKVKAGDQTLTLLVNPSCQNKDKLSEQIGKLTVGNDLTGSYYKLKGKLYLCQIGSGGGGCH